MANVVGIIGLVLSLGAFIVIATGGALPHFVDVFVVRTASEVDDSEAVAGVGVFSSVYDASVLSDEVLAASGVPDDKFDLPTLEFPLLFPAQENFVADVLPITAEQVVDLDDALGTNGAVSDPVVALISAVEDVEFDDCDSYFSTQTLNLLGLFNQVQTSTLPIAFSAVSTEAAGSFDTAIAATAALLGNTTTGSNLHFTLVGALVTFGGLSCPGFNASAPDPTNADKDCLSAFLGNFVNLAGSSTVLGVTMTNVQAHLNSTLVNGSSVNAALFGFVQYQVDVDSVVVGSNFVTYLDNTAVPGAVGFCTFLPEVLGTGAGGCFSAEYLAATASMWSQAAVVMLSISSNAATLAAGLSSGASALAAYLGALNVGLIAAGSSIAEHSTAAALGGLLSSVSVVPLVNFSASYDEHCIYVQAFQSASGANFSVPASGTCSFREYLVGLPLFLAAQDNSLTATVEQISALYLECDVGSGGSVDACPLLFSYALLDGAFQGDIGINATTDFDPTTGIATFNARGAEKCEEDVTDNEKIAQAQVLIIVGYVFYALTFFIAIGSLVSSNPFLFGISGVFAIVGGVLVIGALLTVRSAPVYGSVGDEPELEDGQSIEDLDFEPLYQEGAVVLMALIAAVVEMLAGVLFFCAAVSASASKGVSADEYDADYADEKEEKKPAKAIEQEEAPAVDAKEDGEADVVPGTNVSI